ncbi:MAG: MurR/RpiR family transcriptional regulator [Planctomycetota bacterium]
MLPGGRQMSISDLIAAAGDRLTPTDRRIAQSLLDDPALVVFGTVSDLADTTGVSRPSIVRFATKLGFEGFADLQRQAREGIASQLGTPSQRIRQSIDDADSDRRAIEVVIHHAIRSIDQEQISRIAAPLVAAERVLILSGESSRAGATALTSGLTMIRPHVRLIDDHVLAREVSAATPNDAAIVFDFARYRRTTLLGAKTLSQSGVRVLAITDGPLSPLASCADDWCELAVPAVGPFDSSVPAVLAAELIVHEVVRLLGDEAKTRIDRLEQFWDSTKTFVADG